MSTEIWKAQYKKKDNYIEDQKLFRDQVNAARIEKLEKDKSRFNPMLEKLPARIQSGKPRCPEHKTPSTDIGTCPYCHIRIRKRWKAAKPKKRYELIAKKNLKIGDEIYTKGSTTRFIPTGSEFFKHFEMKEYNCHEVFTEYKSHPRINSEINEEEAAIKNKRRAPIYSVKEAHACECGCKVNVMDEDHGEIVCPKCGLVHEKVLIGHVDGRAHLINSGVE